MSKKKPKNRIIDKPFVKPSEYMRTWHPELFSDTPPLNMPVVERSTLEYHIDTLTNRKQEQAFEEFCRRLVEREICPNLKPQTGPTGGGDSKTDASTYPVSTVLAERCYWGRPKPTTDEFWAFAFSCKKKWQDKIKDDMDKIGKLDRKFTNVFFISNQFTPDKLRSKHELELSKKYGFQVHVMDRSWIVNKVVEYGHEDLVIDILKISIDQSKRPKLGPRDASRQRELDILLERLKQPQLYFWNDYALAQDYLKAAKLARGVGKPRADVDALFLRSRDLAKKNGYEGQIIRCGYEHAWTSSWWFDDPVATELIYSEMEQYLPGTNEARDCLLFSNLWKLLYVPAKRKLIQPEKARLSERLSQIKIELNRLARDKNRPNNALHAETILHLVNLFELIQDPSKAKSVFEGLEKCLLKSGGLGTYPAMEIINTLSRMGDVFGDLPGYNSLFSVIARIAKERLGESSEGELLRTRGLQLLDKNKPREALVYLGQAQVKLAKEETLKEGILAGIGCSIAYRSIGLYWAARIESLSAAHVALRSMKTTDEFHFVAIYAVMQMSWLELLLGRIAPFIACYQLSGMLLEHLRSMQYNVQNHEEELQTQELVLGCLFLNLHSQDVRDLSELQHGLDQVNLPMARWALLYALDEINILVKEVPKEWSTTRSKLDEIFKKWKEQPASLQTPKSLKGQTGSHCKYETMSMGVHYCLNVRSSFGPIAFAENLIGIIEAALATAEWANLAFIVEDVKIFIDVDESGSNPPDLNLNKPPHPKGYEFVWRPDMLEWLNSADRKEVTDYLMQFFLKLLLDITIDPMEDLKNELDRWYNEDVFDRILGMSPSSIALADVLGKESYDLKYWCKTTTP